MTLILGLDIATKTGWAYSKGRSAQHIESGTFRCQGGDVFEKSDNLEAFLHQLIREKGVPDYCVIEKPMRAGPNPSTLADQGIMFGAAKAVIGGYQRRREYIVPSVWRKRMYGFGTHKGWATKDWKAEAKRHCRLIGLEVRSDDEAEAIMISQYGFTDLRFKAQTQGVSTISKKSRQTREKQHQLEGI